MTCELCTSKVNVQHFTVSGSNNTKVNAVVHLCEKCLAQVERRAEPDHTHLGCLKESMWSENPAIQVISWRLLHRFKNETWAGEALDMMYLDEDLLAWAEASGDHLLNDGDGFHRDSNGTLLQNGDSVVLIKTLDVKGSSANAKLGTVVKNIRLVPDNTEQIEGRIDGQLIVILTKYLRKN